MNTGLIFNIQKYSVHDGPGIRTTVFLKGCPLRCAWCHNPESLSSQRELMVVETRCLECGECRRACPEAHNAPGETVLPARVEHCQGCGACIVACPTGARRFVGEEFDVRQVLEKIEQDRVFYDNSGGGVTFSGGEPLSQFEFLRALLAACRERRLHTAVDTSGLAPEEHLLAVAPLTSVFLYDLKLVDEARHRDYTGVSNERILRNLRTLGRHHEQIWLRVPVIPGVNDSEQDLEALGRLAAELPSVRQVNLLPYHRVGAAKARRVGRPERLAEVVPPTAEAMRQAAGVLERFGLQVVIGG